MAVFYVQLVSTTVDQVASLQQDVDVRLQRSRVSLPVSSLSDVASSDTESSDTATNTTDELKDSQGLFCNREFPMALHSITTILTVL